MVVMNAYNLKDYQVQGPDWIDSLGFDINAKVPANATKEQLPLMVQAMLAERFHLTFHRETKEMPVFALVVAKGGPKLTEVKLPETPHATPPPPEAGLRGGRDGAPAPLKSGPGVRMMMTPTGVQLAGYVTMARLCDVLTRQMGRPVLDQTELTATYDVNITFMPDATADGGPMMGGKVGPGPGVSSDAPRSANEPTMTLAQALQTSLGLKLDPRKSAAELLIIEHADKVPVEN
jgi:uncharacterized protein (TIGR03435 family)